MFIGKVRGTVVTTQKVDAMVAQKLLIVEPMRADEDGKTLKPTGRTFIAVDAVGAGDDEIVLVTQGSSARMAEHLAKAPVDCVITAILDTVSVLGTPVFRKQD